MMIARRAHRWLLLMLGLLLVAGHAVLLRYALSHLSLSAAAVVGVIALVMIKFFALRRGLRASRSRGERPR
jgi:drug/metabolite transporter (DMT)-like permease